MEVVGLCGIIYIKSEQNFVAQTSITPGRPLMGSWRFISAREMINCDIPQMHKIVCSYWSEGWEVKEDSSSSKAKHYNNVP